MKTINTSGVNSEHMTRTKETQYKQQQQQKKGINGKHCKHSKALASRKKQDDLVNYTCYSENARVADDKILPDYFLK